MNGTNTAFVFMIVSSLISSTSKNKIFSQYLFELRILLRASASLPKAQQLRV